jgi:hypothetical protein
LQQLPTELSSQDITIEERITIMAIHSSIPKECHLWKDGNPSKEQLRNDLEIIKVYEDESDIIRSLKKCKYCEQLYFYEFLEWADWDDGNDPQYTTWIPVQDMESADELNELSYMEMLRFPGIRSDFPSDANKPSEPEWSVRKDPS